MTKSKQLGEHLKRPKLPSKNNYSMMIMTFVGSALACNGGVLSIYLSRWMDGEREGEWERDWHTCLSILFSFCNVESLSSSSPFFFSKSLTLASNSVRYAFFLSLACCADTLFLSNLLPTPQLPKCHHYPKAKNMFRVWKYKNGKLQKRLDGLT